MNKRKHLGVILLALLLGLTAIPTKQVCAENQEVDVKGEIILSTDKVIIDESDAPDYNGQVDVTVILEGDYSDVYSAVVLPYQCDKADDGQLLMYCDSEKSTSTSEKISFLVIRTAFTERGFGMSLLSSSISIPINPMASRAIPIASVKSLPWV